MRILSLTKLLRYKGVNENNILMHAEWKEWREPQSRPVRILDGASGFLFAMLLQDVELRENPDTKYVTREGLNKF